jgi:hypothetical protein
MANASINCLTPLLEPFGTTDQQNTPLYLNIGETMFVEPVVENTTLAGDEEYVWDFDASNQIKDVVPVITNNEAYPIAFSRKGERYISLNVYDKVPYINVDLISSPILKQDSLITNISISCNNASFSYHVYSNVLYRYNLTNFVLLNSFAFDGTAFSVITTSNSVVLLTSTHIYKISEDLTTSSELAFTDGKELCDSSIDNFVAITNSDNDYIYIYDISTNNIISTFLTGQGNSKACNNTLFYSVNYNTNKIDVINPYTLDHTQINLSRVQPLRIFYNNNTLYVRYQNHIDAYNMNYTFKYTINTFSDYFTDHRILFNDNDEAILFLDSNSKCLINKFDTNTGILSDISLLVNQLTAPKIDVYSNSMLYYFVNNTNNTKNIVNVSLSDLNENILYQVNTNVTFFVIHQNIYYALGQSEFYVLNTISTLSSTNVRGKLIASSTKNFQVYDFPKEIISMDVATYQEVLTISVDDELDAESYSWYINNISHGNGKSILYTYGADVKTNIKCVIKSGYITKTLTKQIVLSKKNEANNYKYESDITPNLMFFNKEGDMINMEYSDNVWKSELYFDTNSSDTYKTIGINIMENVAPIDLETDDNLLIKNQVFNEHGIEFNKGGSILDISDISVVDKINYTKKIFVNTSHIKKGYEIQISDAYYGVVINNVLVSHESAEINTNTNTLTVIDVTKDYIIVNSSLPNNIYNKTYIKGSFRDSNNTTVEIPVGKIHVLNTIKLRDTDNYNTDWNEPYCIDSLFHNKPLSVINTTSNDGVYRFDKIADRKYYKQYICDIPVYGDISFILNTQKLELGAALVTMLPSTFLNSNNIFIWDKTLTKDYTPVLLKTGNRFSFYETPNNYTITAKNIASKLLSPISNTQDGFKIKITNKFAINLIVNKSNFKISETDFPKSTLYDLIKNVSNYFNLLDNLTSFYDDDTIYIYPLNKAYVDISSDTITVTTPGCLSNRPNMVLINDDFVELSNQTGYIHYDHINDSYNLFYNNEWVIIPSDKMIVYATPDSTITYSSANYSAYLVDNKFSISYDSSYKNFSNFITKNSNVLNNIGLNTSIVNNKVVFEQVLLSNNENYVIPELEYTINNIPVDILVLDDESVLSDERNKNISKLINKKIVFNELIGEELIININGIDYKTPNVETTTPELNIEYTLLNWGLSKYIDENNNIESDTYYFENLEAQGILVYLSKTSSTFDTLNIQSRYPNQTLNVSVNQKATHKQSDVIFDKIINALSVTIHGKIYSVSFNNSVEQTISDLVSKYSSFLYSKGIIISNNSNVLSFYTTKDTELVYTIYAGINDTSAFTQTFYRTGNQGCVIASNEVRNLTDDFEAYNFSTGMIVDIENSVFYNNNQEYNILYVDNSSLVLSYQGPFWRSDDTIGYIYSRTGFEWFSYTDIINASENTTNGVFSDTNVSIQDNYINPSYTIFDPTNDQLVVLHNNGTPQDKATIIDLKTNTIFGTVNLGQNPVHGAFNSETQEVYVVNTNSIKISVLKEGVLSDEILIGYQANHLVFDYKNDKTYLTLPYDNSVLCLNKTNNTQTTIFLSNNATPIKSIVDTTRNLLYVLSSDNMIYVVDTLRDELTATYNTGDSPTDISFDGTTIYTINQSNSITFIDNFLAYNIELDATPISMAMSRNNNILYVLTNLNKIAAVSTISNKIEYYIDTIDAAKIKLVPFSNKLFIYNNSNSVLRYFDISDIDTVITTINYDPLSSETTNYLGYTNSAVIATSSDKIHVIEEAPIVTQIQHLLNSLSAPLKIKLASRDFIRYPRERYSDDMYPNMYFEAKLDISGDMFLYDTTGEQLLLQNYIGDINYGNAILTPDMDTTSKSFDISSTYQTVFPIITKQLPYLDDSSDLSLTPNPMQLFIGFKGVYDIVSKANLTITRNKSITNTLTTSKTTSIKDEFIFNSYDNSISVKNTKFNFIEGGYSVNDTIEITGSDKNTNNQYIFRNAGLRCVIEEVYVDKIVVAPINKSIVDESSYNIIAVSTAKNTESFLTITLTILPQTIAEISLQGETVTEDERFKIQTANLGCDIKREDIYIFKEYDILEEGIDWTFMNNKRKEMLMNRTDIYNYIGSYKALVNSVNFFGYNDLSLFEYYYNNNDKTYKKLEIPKIFDISTISTSNDYIKQVLPNDKYKKTNLFNLTYDITDTDGNYIQAYSLDEIITKLLGLKKWLQSNVMPLGMRIKDITGVSTTKFSNQISVDNKSTTKIIINDTLTPMDFEVKAILQPVKNNSATYSVNIKFINEVSEYFSIKINTYYKIGDAYRYVQNFNYYKTDNSSLNITCDVNVDPYIIIETVTDNGYGATYSVKKTYNLISNTFE